MLASIALAAGVAIGAIGAAAPAGAQTTVFSCSYSVNPTTLPVGGGFVTVSGVAPGNTTVRVFTNGVLAATTQSAPITGAFSTQVFITASVEISVALDGYPSTPCIGVGGENVEQDGNGGNIIVGGVSTTRRNLAYTGSSDTRPFVLLGVGALCVGLVLVVAARRRSHVHGRD